MEYYLEVLEIYMPEASHYKISLPLFNGVYLENEHMFHLLSLNISIRRKKSSFLSNLGPTSLNRTLSILL